MRKVVISAVFAVVCAFAVYYMRSMRREQAEFGSWAVDSSYSQFNILLTKIDSGEISVTSVEEFIRLLPDSLKEHYVLMYDSRSLQTASFKFPRAIVFSADGTVIYSFNGEKDQAGYDQVEIAMFDKLNNQVKLRELDFSMHDTQRGVLSKTNPDQCIGCHTSTSKYIWDSYPFWPGAFGSEDDVVFSDGTYANYDVHVKEKTQLNNFMKNMRWWRRHPRYSLLKKKLPITPDRSLRPNHDFSQLTYHLSMMQIAQQIINDEHLHALLLPIVKTALDLKACVNTPSCDYSFEYFSDSISKKIKSTFKENINYVFELKKEGLRAKDFRQKSLLKGYHSERFLKGDMHDRIQAIEDGDDTYLYNYFASEDLYMWAFLKSLGDLYDLDVRRWSLDFYPRSFQLMDSNYNMNLIGKYIMMIQCNLGESLYALTGDFNACLSSMKGRR